MAHFLLFHVEDLTEVKEKIQSQHPFFQNAFSYLIEQANQELLLGPYSVTQKTKIAPSKDPHDYMSLARHYWPNPYHPKDLYIHKDCQTNPEIFSPSYDYMQKNRLVRASILLSLAYYLTNNEVYAAHATFLLKNWFLNPSTCMNPNLRYAQIIPGKNEENHFGIIEGHTFPFVFEAINFLETSSFQTELYGIKKWAKSYLSWLLTSSQGKKEQKTLNNHASWYDFQVLYFALYTDEKKLAFDVVKNWTRPKLSSHFKQDGSLPKELIRKKGFYYSLFNLQALFYSALLAQKIGIDLWNVQEKDRPILRKGLDFLIPYFTNNASNCLGIEPSDLIELYPLLLIASTVYNEPLYFLSCQNLEEKIWDYDDNKRQLSFKILKLLHPRSFLTSIKE